MAAERAALEAVTAAGKGHADDCAARRSVAGVGAAEDPSRVCSRPRPQVEAQRGALWRARVPLGCLARCLATLVPAAARAAGLGKGALHCLSKLTLRACVYCPCGDVIGADARAKGWAMDLCAEASGQGVWLPLPAMHGDPVAHTA